MIGDHLVSSLNTKGLKYWQNLYEFQFAHEESAELNINTARLTTPQKISDELDRITLEHLYTTKNIILSLFDLKSKIVPKRCIENLSRWYFHLDWLHWRHWI